MRALPNWARIGFTGTPIMIGVRKRTHEIFGPFIDTYTIKQSEADHITGPIIYEDRTAQSEIADRRSLDQLFEDMFLGRAHPYLDTIQRLECATVISGAKEKPPSWKFWSRKSNIDDYVARFKKPLFHDDPKHRDSRAFLCVQSMLITGFDAPYEQVLYLDRGMHGYELLQAIARVNRTAPKSCGFERTDRRATC